MLKTLQSYSIGHTFGSLINVYLLLLCVLRKTVSFRVSSSLCDNFVNYYKPSCLPIERHSRSHSHYLRLTLSHTHSHSNKKAEQGWSRVSMTEIWRKGWEKGQEPWRGAMETSIMENLKMDSGRLFCGGAVLWRMIIDLSRDLQTFFPSWC